MKKISKYALTLCALFMAMLLTTSCEHKPLYERAPKGTDRIVRLNFDWSGLENADDMPQGVTVLFYDVEHGGFLKYDLPHGEEDTELTIPSGAKYLIVYNNDQSDFIAVTPPDQYHGHYLSMEAPYVGLNNIYYYSKDITVYPPEDGVEHDVQVINVKPYCMTPHLDISVLGINSINTVIKTWGVTVSNLCGNSAPHSSMSVGAPITISKVLTERHNEAFCSIRTLGLHPEFTSGASPCILRVQATAENGGVKYYSFDVSEQVRKQETSHRCSIIVDITGKQPDNPDGPTDVSGSGMNPAVDNFGSENIEIEM